MSAPVLADRRRLLHLAGSPTSTAMADLSLLYARDCLATNAGRSDDVIAVVEPDGRWCLPASLEPADLAAAERVDLATALGRVVALRPDVAVPQLFCLAGMTHVRGLLDLLGLPYVGNTPATMALAADKAHAKAVVAAAGVATPAWEVVDDAAAVTLRATSGAPLVVKPVDGDNSWGLSFVADDDGLPAAVAEARRWGRAALVEEFVPLGREVRCGVLERPDHPDAVDGLLVLPLEEYAVHPDHKPVRDAADKLAGGGADLRLVAKDAAHAWLVPADDAVVPAVAEAARAAHRALGCRHYSLFDFRIDPAGVPWFLEAGPYCSFASQSVVAVMARGAGIDTPDLLADVVDLALSPRAPRAPEPDGEPDADP